jgi:polygalacturonase
MPRLLPFLSFLAIAISSPALEQDTRNVTEPKVPPFCATLDAHLVSVNDSKFNTLAAADESKLDTDRIQKAIDACGKGKAVALQTHDTANAFLSGPLELREGVALVVDRGVTLFESIDPQVLEISPGSCGVVNTAPGRGCRPLISVNHVSGAGVMGEGVIDGRGGGKLLGKDDSA